MHDFLTTHALPVGEDLHVGSNVVVLNHGKHWQHQAEILYIDEVNDSAVIRWDATRKKETVHLNDLVKYSTNNSQSKKLKSTNFFVPLPDTKIVSTKLSNDDDIVTGSQV